MKSLWTETEKLPSFGELPGDITVDTAVIGGGMAGLLCAYLLREKGVKAVVLEADVIAGGQTRNTTAKITSQHGLLYEKLLEEQGHDLARQYAGWNQRAIDRYEEMIGKLGVDCDFDRLPSYLYTMREPEVLKKEARAAASLGIPAVYTEETTLPFSVKGAVRFASQAQFHPLKFLSALADKLTVYEHTKVLKAEDHKLYTPQGCVTAKKIIFAVHYPFVNHPGYYFMRMHQDRSYVVALEKAQTLDGMYYGIDKEDGLSFRNAGDLLLLGGGSHRTGENSAGGKYEYLRQKAEELYPGCREKYCWSAQDCMTLDDIPYIGRFSSSQPDWYVATGFRKWGMTTSMVSAILLSEAIAEEKESFGIFSPQRFTPGASAGNFCKEAGHAVKDLGKNIFAVPKADIEELPEGHGGVVEYDGRKTGVYKEEGGEVYLVSVRCPHLGCQLAWNPDEKTWECPCHGSRFDKEGKLLDNPAQTDLEKG